jgi:hypothetical protein
VIYVCFFVPNADCHPDFELGIYDAIWPIMHRSLRDNGCELVHLTDAVTTSRGDSVFRVDGIDPKKTMLSRDIAWLRFLEQMPKDDQVCMVEPDTMMVRPVTPLDDEHDLVLLRRYANISPGFRLAKKTSLPFYRAVMAAWKGVPVEKHVFHGDVDALHAATGATDAMHIPLRRHGCSIDIRGWEYYIGKGSKNAELWNFKGTSKRAMLQFAQP